MQLSESKVNHNAGGGQRPAKHGQQCLFDPCLAWLVGLQEGLWDGFGEVSSYEQPVVAAVGVVQGEASATAESGRLHFGGDI